jgi:oxalate decarboxylase
LDIWVATTRRSSVNSNADLSPPTDHRVVEPFWHSLDLTHRRIQEGGWTHQVTSRELPVSKDVAGLNMRLTKSSFREPHHDPREHLSFL